MTNAEQAKTFANVHCEIFNLPLLLRRKEQWAQYQFKISLPDAINFIARIDGKVAGISSLIFNKQFDDYPTGGFYNACVFPQYRRRGVGMAMACHRIAVARKYGLKNLSIVLMSDAMARGYCECLGFTKQAKMIPYYVD